MEEDIANYDAAVGSSVNVPPAIPLSAFGQARIDEIFMLTESLEEPPAKGQLFQRLPKHMRRRQMSHHDSRLPRRLRNNISLQAKDAPSKRPSRKYRRKPRNLLSEYERRQRDKIWLETHIWHAKRFHMTEKWGYKLAVKPTNKAFRANYRGTARHCLLIDLSYFNCIELIGQEDNLLSGLQSCTSTQCGLTFRAKYYLDGSREGSLTFFRPHSYPDGVIGNITFLWKLREPAEVDRTLWLWVHPATHQEVVDTLTSIFDISGTNDGTEEFGPIAVSKEMAKFTTRNVPFARVPGFKSTKIKIHLLKDTLNRFRLVGPLSSCILADALVPFELPTLNSEPISEEVPAKRARMEDEDVEIVETVGPNAWTKMYSAEHWRNSWNEQKRVLESMKKLSCPTQLPAHAVLSVLALDPRLHKPAKPTKILPLSSGESSKLLYPCWGPDYSRSAIWNSSVRDTCLAEKPSTWDLDKQRSQLIVREVGRKGVAVPVLIIQNPGSIHKDRNGYGSGFDVIIPSGWALPFWHSMVLRGARTGGLREINFLSLESLSFINCLPPDSDTGKTEIAEKALEAKADYLALPPAKRPNFMKLGIPDPFTPLWTDLSRLWGSDSSNCVLPLLLRDQALLRRLSEATSSKTRDLKELPLPANAGAFIVPIAVFAQSGRPETMAHLYIPLDEDIKLFKKKASGEKDDQAVHLTEPCQMDHNAAERKELSTNHKKRLRSEKRKRKKERWLLRDEMNNQPLGTLLPDAFLVKSSNVQPEISVEFNKTIDKLWLPSPEDGLSAMQGCSRKQAGYVTIGDYSFRASQGAGLGFILLPALLQLLQSNNGAFLLLRNVSQFNYRLCTFTVLTE